jgi:hypothetical protein
LASKKNAPHERSNFFQLIRRVAASPAWAVPSDREQIQGFFLRRPFIDLLTAF